MSWLCLLTLASALEPTIIDRWSLAAGDALVYVAEREAVADATGDGVEAEHREGSGRAEVALTVVRAPTESRPGSYRLDVLDEPDAEDGSPPALSIEGLRFELDGANGRVRVIGAPRASTARERAEKQQGYAAAAFRLVEVVLRGPAWIPSPGVGGRHHLREQEPVILPTFPDLPGFSTDEGRYVARETRADRVVVGLTGAARSEATTPTGSPLTIMLDTRAEADALSGWLILADQTARIEHEREVPEGRVRATGTLHLVERWRYTRSEVSFGAAP